MDITPVRFTPPTSPSAASGSAAAPVVQVPQQRSEYVAAVKVDVNVNSDQPQQDSDNARLEAVERAARVLKQAFPEFETFTIFKNNSGEFITRITNHTSGTVQYVPEQSILQYLSGKEIFKGNDKVLQLNA